MNERLFSHVMKATGALLFAVASVVVFLWGKKAVVKEVYRDERNAWAARWSL